ncbi:integral membrane protein [Streptomyces lincolnensis]|nr:integral membrane protein [Streptomyces lincolnensis]
MIRGVVIRMRTGSEPRTARSALRVRFWLSVWGLIWAVFGTVAFALAGRPGWAIACGVLWLVVTADLIMILRHIRQGPHYQPGPDIPPYRPAENPRPQPPENRRPGPP